jgi:hypothetical protein
MKLKWHFSLMQDMKEFQNSMKWACRYWIAEIQKKWWLAGVGALTFEYVESVFY